MPLDNVKLLRKRCRRTEFDSPESEISPRRTRQRTRIEEEQLQEILSNIKMEPIESVIVKNNRLYNECMDNFDDISLDARAGG